MKLTLALLVLGVVAVSARCPNGCSGHGNCGAFDKCSCHQNWIGSDCSERQCPFELAWVDTANKNSEAHYYAECSNKGICDRKTGECKCFEGYEGKGCRRSTCPNDCSGHGTCEFIEELAVDTADVRVVDPVARALDGSVTTYALWDENKIQGCKCDAGYQGSDCSSRVCPNGDDPLTTGQQQMVQLVVAGDGGTTTIASTDEIFLTYRDPYGARWTTTAIVIDQSDKTTRNAAAQAALRALPNHALDAVTVTSVADSTTVTTQDAGRDGTTDVTTSADNSNFYVTFPDETGTTGLQYLLACDYSERDADTGYGFQPISAGAPGCSVYEVEASSDYAENSVCSNRGTCDGSSGTCQCFTGFRGLACEEQEALV